MELSGRAITFIDITLINILLSPAIDSEPLLYLDLYIQKVKKQICFKINFNGLLIII